MKKKHDVGELQVGYFPEVKLTEAELKARGERKPPRKRPPAGRMIFMAVCAVVFITSTVLLINYFSNINRAKQATAQLRDIYTSSSPETDEQDMLQTSQLSVTATTIPTASTAATLPATQAPTVQPTVRPAAATLNAVKTAAPVTSKVLSFTDLWPSSYENNPQLRISSSFETLRQQNRDIVGWLTIEGVLDEPVLQRDNEFYLTHDATGAKNVTGALFLDENCNLRLLPNSMLIHGHNMKEGAMFGSLKKYKVKDASFYKENPYITFNTLYEEGRYVIFAVAEININADDRYYVPFWQYMNFSSQSAFDQFIGKLKEFSHFQTEVDVVPGDRLLTLATCAGDDPDLRLLVVARRIREGEDTIALSQGILSTTVK